MFSIFVWHAIRAVGLQCVVIMEPLSVSMHALKWTEVGLWHLYRFMFDEPSSYLDVKQRLRAAVAIRNLIAANKYIIVVEHDLSVLDYMSDFICCLYGVPGAYGVVTMPFSVREGIVCCA